MLYAPTYRDQVVDRRGRFRLDLQLDLERLRAAVGDDTVILFRKHHYIADAVPATADGFVRDVSSFPDGTELMLAADVLITDYSSMMVDFANTGRPMLFYTYDLDAYADEIRGFYLDFVETVPGPLLRTTDEVADALARPRRRAGGATPSATRPSARRSASSTTGARPSAWSTGCSERQPRWVGERDPADSLLNVAVDVAAGGVPPAAANLPTMGRVPLKMRRLLCTVLALAFTAGLAGDAAARTGSCLVPGNKTPCKVWTGA